MNPKPGVELTSPSYKNQFAEEIAVPSLTWHNYHTMPQKRMYKINIFYTCTHTHTHIYIASCVCTHMYTALYVSTHVYDNNSKRIENSGVNSLTEFY